jgi:hypothetical protein
MAANGNYYVIRVREKLDPSWAEWFDPMALQSDGDETILSGHLPDQAALHGMLARVNNLGLQLVAVNRSESAAGE